MRFDAWTQDKGILKRYYFSERFYLSKLVFIYPNELLHLPKVKIYLEILGKRLRNYHKENSSSKYLNFEQIRRKNNIIDSFSQYQGESSEQLSNRLAERNSFVPKFHNIVSTMNNETKNRATSVQIE